MELSQRGNIPTCPLNTKEISALVRIRNESDIQRPLFDRLLATVQVLLYLRESHKNMEAWGMEQLSYATAQTRIAEQTEAERETLARALNKIEDRAAELGRDPAASLRELRFANEVGGIAQAPRDSSKPRRYTPCECGQKHDHMKLCAAVRVVKPWIKEHLARLEPVEKLMEQNGAITAALGKHVSHRAKLDAIRRILKGGE